MSGCYLPPPPGNPLRAIGRLLGGSSRQAGVFVFRGLETGRFSDRQALLDRLGNPVTETHAGREGRPRVLATEPFLTDWDADGDLDLLVGNWNGEIILVRNDGTRTYFAYASTGIRLEHGGQPIGVPGGLAGPEVADWDGDGLPDLLSGSSAGGVVFFRNEGTRAQPRYARGMLLVPSGMLNQYLWPSEEPTPGSHTRIHVTDHDGDGKLDLLLGDVQFVSWFRASLTDDEAKEVNAWRRQWRDALAEAERMLATDASAQVLHAMQERIDRLDRRLNSYVEAETRHGFVWLFRRK
ncbi:MAG: VCBS repeat-containing protein [Planctomycetes bacterium]|nr:VCBS repeat-containing protein [Planctomycetota bacterium]